MKKILKVFAIVALIVSSFGGMAAVFADDNTGDNTDEYSAIRPEKGNLTIHKYLVDDVSEIGSEGDGTEKEEDKVAGDPVEGVAFNVYSLKCDEGAPVIPPSEKDGAVYNKIKMTINEEDVEKLQIKIGSATYTYTMSKITDTAPSNGLTDDDGTLSYEGLAAGYYYVEEDLENSTKDAKALIDFVSRPFIVAVPMTNSDGDGWNADVHVYPKNQGADTQKTANGEVENSVNVGDVINYEISVALPADIGEFSTFNFRDVLDAALAYGGEDTVKVFVSNKKDGKIVADAKVYIPQSVSEGDDKKVYWTVTDTDSVIRVEFTEDGLKHLATFVDDGKDTKTHVGMEFQATVNENIFDKEYFVVENKGYIEWNSDPEGDGDPKETPTPETQTPVGEIEVDKRGTSDDPAAGNLKGAEFQIAATEDGAEAGEFIKVLVNDKGRITKLVNPEDDDYQDALDWIILPNATTEEIEEKQEEIDEVFSFYDNSFKGLKVFENDGSKDTDYLTYYLVETKAPKGYNLLGSPEEVTFTAAAKDNDGKYKEKHSIVPIVYNTKGFTLPRTGGPGLIILTIFGIVLVGLGIMVALPKKRKNA